MSRPSMPVHRGFRRRTPAPRAPEGLTPRRTPKEAS